MQCRVNAQPSPKQGAGQPTSAESHQQSSQSPPKRIARLNCQDPSRQENCSEKRRTEGVEAHPGCLEKNWQNNQCRSPEGQRAKERNRWNLGHHQGFRFRCWRLNQTTQQKDSPGWSKERTRRLEDLNLETRSCSEGPWRIVVLP